MEINLILETRIVMLEAAVLALVGAAPNRDLPIQGIADIGAEAAASGAPPAGLGLPARITALAAASQPESPQPPGA